MNSTLSLRPPITSAPRFSRNAIIVGSVLVFHGAALWALQSGLIRHVVEIVVPVEMLAQTVEPPKPAEPPPPPPAPVKQPVVKTRTPTPPPAPRPMAIADPTPTANAPTGVTTPQPPAPPIAEPVAEAAAPVAPPAAPPAPPKIVAPSSDANYLNNPRPAYPSMSKRLGEQGTVQVLVHVSADGNAQKVEIKKSSGFDRLDQAALAAIAKWRFVPGKRDGVPEAAWVIVPMPFSLD